MADGVVSLRVGGREYRGWKTARVTRGIEAISGSFDLSVSERWANQDQPWPIGEGDRCELLINGTTVITGYIDSREPSFGPDSHDVALSGRDVTGDMVDSAVVLSNWEFKEVAIPALVQKMCDPHGVKVSVQPGLVLSPITIPKKFSIDPGDTAANAIENACRLAGLLPVSDGKGGLVLTRTGTSRCTTAIVEGKNALAGKAKFSMAGRFAKVLVLGQHKGNDSFNGESSRAVKGSATDPNVPRSARTLVIRPEGNVTAAQATKRAEWEATTRAARADSVAVTVQGWTQNDGTVWPVNTLARVTSPSLGVDGDLLITQATYSLTVTGGTTTTLELKAPDAFKPEPIQKAGGGKHYWKEVVRGV